MNANGASEQYLPTLSITECPYCFETSEVGCDCHLDVEEEESESDYSERTSCSDDDISNSCVENYPQTEDL